MFRVYDNKLKEWCNDMFCVSSDGDLYIVEHSKFGKDKIRLVSDDRYTYQNDIGTYDMNGNLIFEGDIISNHIEPGLIGVVAYAPEHASYYVFDKKNLEYYRLTKSDPDLKIEGTLEKMEVIGNVFDNQELLNFNNDMRKE